MSDSKILLAKANHRDRRRRAEKYTLLNYSFVRGPLSPPGINPFGKRRTPGDALSLAYFFACFKFVCFYCLANLNAFKTRCVASLLSVLPSSVHSAVYSVYYRSSSGLLDRRRGSSHSKARSRARTAFSSPSIRLATLIVFLLTLFYYLSLSLFLALFRSHSPVRSIFRSFRRLTDKKLINIISVVACEQAGETRRRRPQEKTLHRGV